MLRCEVAGAASFDAAAASSAASERFFMLEGFKEIRAVSPLVPENQSAAESTLGLPSRVGGYKLSWKKSVRVLGRVKLISSMFPVLTRQHLKEGISQLAENMPTNLKRSTATTHRSTSTLATSSAVLWKNANPCWTCPASYRVSKFALPSSFIPQIETLRSPRPAKNKIWRSSS